MSCPGHSMNPTVSGLRSRAECPAVISAVRRVRGVHVNIVCVCVCVRVCVCVCVLSVGC